MCSVGKGTQLWEGVRSPHWSQARQHTRTGRQCRIFQLKETGDGGNSSRWHRDYEGRQGIPNWSRNEEFWGNDYKEGGAKW